MSWPRQRKKILVEKKQTCRKKASKQDQFKQKQSFKREKDHAQKFILAYFKLLIAEKLAVSL